MLKKILPLTPKRAITLVLIALMYVVVVASVIELALVLIHDLFAPAQFLLDINQLLDLLGIFLLVLVAIELLDTITAYLDENVVHAEVVIEAALIAVARKIVILNIKEVDALMVLALAALLAALSAGYFLIRRVNERHPPHQEEV